MSVENVEVVRESFRRFAPDNLDHWGELWDLECVSTPANGWPEPGPFVGRAAVVRQFENLFEDFHDVRVGELEIVADSGEWVIAAWHTEGVGVASGLQLALDVVTAFRVSDGLLLEGHFRWEAVEAFAAAGLER